jgi:phosphoglucosamine mutase
VRQAEEALGKRGRIVLRESGTEPVIRLMVEADTDALCDMTATALRDIILSQGF